MAHFQYWHTWRPSFEWRRSWSGSARHGLDVLLVKHALLDLQILCLFATGVVRLKHELCSCSQRRGVTWNARSCRFESFLLPNICACRGRSSCNVFWQIFCRVRSSLTHLHNGGFFQQFFSTLGWHFVGRLRNACDSGFCVCYDLISRILFQQNYNYLWVGSEVLCFLLGDWMYFLSLPSVPKKALRLVQQTSIHSCQKLKSHMGQLSCSLVTQANIKFFISPMVEIKSNRIEYICFLRRGNAHRHLGNIFEY